MWLVAALGLMAAAPALAGSSHGRDGQVVVIAPPGSTIVIVPGRRAPRGVHIDRTRPWPGRDPWPLRRFEGPARGPAWTTPGFGSGWTTERSPFDARRHR